MTFDHLDLSLTGNHRPGAPKIGKIEWFRYLSLVDSSWIEKRYKKRPQRGQEKHHPTPQHNQAPPPANCAHSQHFCFALTVLKHSKLVCSSWVSSFNIIYWPKESQRPAPVRLRDFVSGAWACNITRTCKSMHCLHVALWWHGLNTASSYFTLAWRLKKL